MLALVLQSQGVAASVQEIDARSQGTCVAGASSSCQNSESFLCVKGMLFGACSAEPLPAEDCEAYCRHDLAQIVQLLTSAESPAPPSGGLPGAVALASSHRGMEKVAAKAAKEAAKELAMAENVAAKEAARSMKEVAKQAARSQKVSAHNAERANKVAAKMTRYRDGQDQAAEALAVEKMQEAREQVQAPHDEQQEVRSLGGVLQNASQQQSWEQQELQSRQAQQAEKALPELKPRSAPEPLPSGHFPSPSPSADGDADGPFPVFEPAQQQQQKQAADVEEEHDHTDPKERQQQQQALEEIGSIRDVMDQIPGSDAGSRAGSSSVDSHAVGLRHTDEARDEQDHITAAQARKAAAEAAHAAAQASMESARVTLRAALEKMTTTRTAQAHAEVAAQRVSLLSAAAKDEARDLALQHRVRMPARRMRTPPAALVASRTEQLPVPPTPRQWQPI